MNYIKIYNSIIENSSLRKSVDYYCEKHHIIPSCMGGADSKDNLVRLTYREHFLCHWLLCKIYPQNYKLKSAFFKMLENTKTKKRFASSKEYNIVKRLLKDVKYPWLQKWQIENGSWNKGKKGVQVAWNKGMISGPATDSRKKKTSDTLKKYYETNEHHRKNTDPWNKGKKGVQVAWNKGIKEQRIVCDYCGKDANPGNFKRWHGNNCKSFKE